MKIEKLPSGSYRIRKMINGKNYSLTFDHRPTQAEIQLELNRRATGSFNGTLTFGRACQDYIDDRSNTLSPATIKAYNDAFKRLPESICEKNIDLIRSQDVQQVINNLADSYSPTSVKSFYGFYTSVLSQYRDDLRLKVKLPTREVKPPYIPNTEDIRALLEYFKDTKMELAIRLAAFGLRRGEICALTLDDLDGNYLTINKDKILSPENKWIIKNTPKTKASNRIIYVSDRVVELFHTVGPYTSNPNGIDTTLNRAQDRLGLERFSIHKLRHYFASTALDTMPEKDVMAFGGWSSDVTMKRIYRHRLDDRTKAVSESISNGLN